VLRSIFVASALLAAGLLIAGASTVLLPLSLTLAAVSLTALAIKWGFDMSSKDKERAAQKINAKAQEIIAAQAK
jgi:hypothetical protein